MTNQYTYVLNVVSSDHPGIIAGVSTALYEIEGNIDSCSQTVLDGYFTLILVATLPKQWEPDKLSEHIKSHPLLGQDYKIVAVPVSEPVVAKKQSESDVFVVTAFGKDGPGIVHDFCRYLADKEVNILDLYGRRENDEFLLIAQVQIPPQLSIAVLQDDLEAIAQEHDYTVKLQHNNIFVATNDIRLYD
jgi:Glycine cleavage system regulatory protein